jgi:hypothetical protein
VFSLFNFNCIIQIQYMRFISMFKLVNKLTNLINLVSSFSHGDFDHVEIYHLATCRSLHKHQGFVSLTVTSWENTTLIFQTHHRIVITECLITITVSRSTYITAYVILHAQCTFLICQCQTSSLSSYGLINSSINIDMSS